MEKIKAEAPKKKLSSMEAEFIRIERALGYTLKELSDMYKVPISQIIKAIKYEF